MLLLLAMVQRMLLRRLLRMMSRMEIVSVGNMCMVPSSFVGTIFMMFCRFFMVTSRMLVMLGGLLVMFSPFMPCHI